MDAVALVRLALAVITDRLITILALLTSAGLGCWTMWDPIWQRVSTLAIFVIFAYALVRAKERNEDGTGKKTQASE